MLIKSSARLYCCGLEIVQGYTHLTELVKEKKSIVFRPDMEDINVMPASWFINCHFGWVSARLKECVYVYDKQKIKQNGL